MNSLTLLCVLLNAKSALYTARRNDWTETNGHCFGVKSSRDVCAAFLDLPQTQLNQLRKVTISIVCKVCQPLPLSIVFSSFFKWLLIGTDAFFQVLYRLMWLGMDVCFAPYHLRHSVSFAHLPTSCLDLAVHLSGGGSCGWAGLSCQWNIPEEKSPR